MNTLDIKNYLVENANIGEYDILNIHLYGSWVYHTNNTESDYDFIVVLKDSFGISDIFDRENKINIIFYDRNTFAKALNSGNISCLECYFQPKEYLYKSTHEFNWNEDLATLRTYISTITSNSWVKGKKKLTVLGDYDLQIGLKSVFHSIRILDYGIQIATYKTIRKWDTYNYILDDIRKLSVTYKYDDLWNQINSKYLGLFKQLKHDFKMLCPKENTDHFKEQETIRNIFKKYKIEHPQLSQIIKEILNEQK